MDWDGLQATMDWHELYAKVFLEGLTLQWTGMYPTLKRSWMDSTLQWAEMDCELPWTGMDSELSWIMMDYTVY